MFGQTMCTEQVGVRSDNVHRQVDVRSDNAH
jgi:hypothetical protein